MRSRTWLLLGGLLAATAPARADDAARAEFFESKVRPVLAQRCWSCHGTDKQKAGLRLDSRGAMLQGGESGPALVPGHPESSPLVEAIRYVDALQMPPKGKLNDAEITILSDWVKAGAFWPESKGEIRPAPAAARGMVVTAEDRAFWSFRPIAHPTPPTVRDAAWAKSELDRFVLAPLEAKGMRPVPPAERRALIRRASFDLTGLPPTPEEVEAFVDDTSPEAFAKVVDRLLASPHYGERWGRHWLDVARYGEDQAHTFQARKYPYGYRYRDWVVKALNDDMPYDRFVMEQVAADLLDGPDRDGRLAALGFFALGPVYYGNAKADELDDRVDTLCRGILGLTVACARCHDHKFDPIPTRDYYALAGIVASTDYKEYPHAAPEVVAAFDKGQAAIKEKTDAINAFLKAESDRLPDRLALESARYMVAAWTLVNERKAHPDRTEEAVASRLKLNRPLLTRWVAFLFPAKPDETQTYLKRWRDLIAKQDPKADLSADEGARKAVQEAADAFQTYLRATLALRDAHQAFQSARARIGLEPSPPLGATEQALLTALVQPGGVLAFPPKQAEPLLASESKDKLKALRAELEDLKKKAPAPYPVTHAVAEGANPAHLKVYLRGNPETPGEEAPRRFLSVLSASDPTPYTHGSGRLELARALVDPDNPLTPRVIVNRVWEHHFGRGLVGTPSNFGRLGERPTHPELLDFLAGRFVAGGWSLKALHRTIMLSATYQLGSTFDARNYEADPENLGLWRMNRRRLEVEAWRDAMLAVSGDLDRALGGASLDLASAANRRRTVYAQISRHSLDNLLRLFDFPDPNLTSDRRAVTAVPLQQLFVLNSEFMERQAKSLAARLTASNEDSDADRIRRAIVLLYGRPATEAEVELGVAFLSGEGTAGAPSRWEQYAQVLLGGNEFAFID